MTRLPRPCLGAKNVSGQHEDCGVPVVRAEGDRVARCPRHQAMHEANRRPSSSGRGYDRPYQAERAEILTGPDGEPVDCQLRLEGCTTVATTLHHVVPVDSGRNRAAASRGPKVPACKHCNSALGKRPLDAETPRTSAGGMADGRGVSGGDEDDDDDWFPAP